MVTALLVVLAFILGAWCAFAALVEAGHPNVVYDHEGEIISGSLDPWTRGTLGVYFARHLLRGVPEGALIPPGWGFCYYASLRSGIYGVYAPMPLNVAIRWARKLYEWVRLGRMDDTFPWAAASIEARARVRAHELIADEVAVRNRLRRELDDARSALYVRDRQYRELAEESRKLAAQFIGRGSLGKA